MDAKQRINTNLFEHANLIPLSADGTSYVRGRRFGINSYKWIDLSSHSKQFLAVLLLVNLLVDCLYFAMAGVMTFVVKQSLTESSWQALIVYVPFAVIALLLLYVSLRGLRSCLRLVHYIRRGF